MRIPQAGEEFGRYRLDRQLGVGGMGVVYAATDLRLHRTVALKIITGSLAASEEFRARFQHEAEALAQLDSRHVVAIYDHDEVEGTPYIVMQFVDGGDLAGRIVQGGPMPVRLALDLSAQIAQGLADAHARGVLHRDVKPANVLLSEGRSGSLHAYLCDFGIARADHLSGPELTVAGQVTGTWSYLAPERADGSPATESTDLYALGCLLWVCLTGQPPYVGTEAQVIVGHQQGPVPQVPGTTAFDGELNGVLARLLAKDPETRMSSADEAHRALAALLASAPDAPLSGVPTAAHPTVQRPAATTPPPPPPPSAPAPAAGRTRRRWPWVAGGVAALAALATVAGVAVWTLSDGDEPGPAADDNTSDTEQPAAIADDLNGDGFGDLLVHQERPLSDTPLSVWTVPSNGVALDAPERTPAEPGTVVLGDVDGDDRPDRLWADEETEGELSVVVQPGDGEPWTTAVPLGADLDLALYATLVADVDGDGSGDLVLLNDPYEGAAGVFVARGNGDGFDAPTQWFRADDDGYLWAGDLDDEPGDELVYWVGGDAAESSGTMQVLKADGERFAVAASEELAGAAINPTIASWEVGDVDGDGVQELVAPNITRRVVYVYRFDGTAIADREAWHRTARSVEDARKQLFDSGVLGYALSDVDGNGSADLVEMHAPEEGTTTIRFDVLLSDGEQFADAAEWGVLDCGADCEDDAFRLIS